jgi:hypothetical protein
LVSTNDRHYDAAIGDELPGSGNGAGQPSLSDDVSALIADTQTYIEAEINYQKSRAALLASKGKRATVFALVSFAFLNSALIALVVGLVLTLAPVLTPAGATALVFGVLMAGAVTFALMARSRFRKLSRIFDGDQS